jgi:ribonuclease R
MKRRRTRPLGQKRDRAERVLRERSRSTPSSGQTDSLPLETILQLLAERSDGLTREELEGAVGEAMEEQTREWPDLSRGLSRLQGTGLVQRVGKGYRLNPSRRVLTGTIRQRRRKLILFVPDSSEDLLAGPIRVEPEDLLGAFDGDRVIARIDRGERRHERFARVEMILRRGQLRIVGRLHHRFSGMGPPWVESLDEKFGFEIDLEGPEADAIPEGAIVAVEVTTLPAAGRAPRGRVGELIGKSSTEPGLDIEIVIRKHDLPHRFPPEVREEASRISPSVTEEERHGRLDLRDLPTVTIDGETARDFDDAISLQRLENGRFLLDVHIADVSWYVREGTALDAEARLRGTSVYFPERAIPMLPEELSNEICSLRPQVDRLALTARMEVTQTGEVARYQIRETVIRSNERMTYTDVNRILEGQTPELMGRYADLLELFQTMESLAQILIRQRQARGAIDFNLPESIFEFDDEGRVAGVLKADRNIAHRLIEEFMLLANETVASHLQELGIPSVYRIHQAPDPIRVLEFAQLAQAYGYRFPVSEVRSHDYQRLSRQLEGKPEERVLAYAMLRSLQRARYAAENEGHFGLAAPVYTHFTSPIRRYPDLLVHRLLRGLLRDHPDWGDSSHAFSRRREGEPPPIPLDLPLLRLLAWEASERERAADAAEMEIDQWRKAAFMAERIGEEFDGMITHVREFGFFVELTEFFIEGLVAIRSMTDDFYQFNPQAHSLIGRHHQGRFRLGDQVRVRVDRVHVDRHLVDFSVVAQEGEQRKTRSGRRRR